MPDHDTSENSSSFDYYDDPLYLSTSDQPSATLSSFLFERNDFLGWKREVLMALAAKNKDDMIDRSCSCPPSTDKCHKQWKRCDFMVMRWISNSLDKNLMENFKFVTSSKELWNELIERFGQSNALEVYQLTKDLGAVSQENLSLVEYYSKMKNLWETLDPLPSCSCGKISLCSCTLMKKMIDRENNAKIIQFLINLNSNYDGVRTQILSLDPLPSINKVLALLQKIERQKQITDTVSVLTDANAYASYKQSESKKSGDAGPSNVKHCDHCNNNGHTRATCFGLTKYPHCNKTCHNPANCFLIRGFPGDKTKGKEKLSYNKDNPPKRGANTVDVISESPLEDSFSAAAKNTGSVVLNSTSGAFNGISSDVLDGLITSIIDHVLKRISKQQQAGLSSANFAGMMYPSSFALTADNSGFLSDWIVDTGASDHMTYDVTLFSDIHVFKRPIRVGLLDGSIKFVYKMGTVLLTDKIKLFYVFYIPDFKQNLLSVSKLLDHHNMTVMFSSHDCVFQDLTNDVIVAKGRRIGDLYRFHRKLDHAHLIDNLVHTFNKLVMNKFLSKDKNISFLHSTANSASDSKLVDLFHARLGHMSVEKLKFVSDFSHSSIHGNVGQNTDSQQPGISTNIRISSRPTQLTSRLKGFQYSLPGQQSVANTVQASAFETGVLNALSDLHPEFISSMFNVIKEHEPYTFKKAH
ncbi:uncharacterized protein LOC141607628 [Silene latifolia]|uniref:uncharacterized protein LOC141607628 n=1 Tax=Silene latifolia TaxID=37657 RepID=UPI003D78AA9B